MGRHAMMVPEALAYLLYSLHYIHFVCTTYESLPTCSPDQYPHMCLHGDTGLSGMRSRKDEDSPEQHSHTQHDSALSQTPVKCSQLWLWLAHGSVHAYWCIRCCECSLQSHIHQYQSGWYLWPECFPAEEEEQLVEFIWLFHWVHQWQQWKAQVLFIFKTVCCANSFQYLPHSIQPKAAQSGIC